jgi:hypothetical protein
MIMRRNGLLGLCAVLGVGCSEAAHRLGGNPEEGGGGGEAGATGDSSPTGGSAENGGSSGEAPEAPGTGGDSAAQGGSSPNGTAGSGTGTVDDDLSGTWDVVGTALGGTSRFTVSLSETSIVVAAQTFAFNVLANADGYDVDYRYDPFAARLVVWADDRQPFGLGAFPIDLGGIWAIEGVGELDGCSFSLAEDTASSGCGNVSGPSFMTHVRRRSLLGTRISRLDSSFGNLGGEWTFTGSEGTACALRAEGREVEGFCNSPPLRACWRSPRWRRPAASSRVAGSAARLRRQLERRCSYGATAPRRRPRTTRRASLARCGSCSARSAPKHARPRSPTSPS